MIIFYILLLTAINNIMGQNIVVFVHGIAGFGPDEMLGINYWGFNGLFGSSHDYMQLFRNAGFTVHYAKVGPVSSNWDRACELYAQIKGTRVDYGKSHSASNHASVGGVPNRFGKDFTGRGFYPSWNGANKIHFVAHSMGGTTIRMLEYLLQNGRAEEVSAAADVSPLFRPADWKNANAAGTNWIASMTTLATPHDGSTLHTKLGDGFTNLLKNMIVGTVNLLPPGSSFLWDLELHQFGITQGTGSWTNYVSAVFSSPVWATTFKDLASWDLSPQASKEFNQLTRLTYPGTFYFSATTFTTTTILGNDFPNFNTEFIMAPTATTIGVGGTVCDSFGNCFDNSWEPNDGLVPMKSSASPRLGIPSYVAPATWTPTTNFVRGKWYNRQVNRDHTQIVGWCTNVLMCPFQDSAGGIYSVVVQTLQAIRNAPLSLEAPETTEEVVEDPTGLIIGSIIGSLSFIALIAGLVVVTRRKRHSLRMINSFQLTTGSPRVMKQKQQLVVSGSFTSKNPEFLKETMTTVNEITTTVEEPEEESKV